MRTNRDAPNAAMHAAMNEAAHAAKHHAARDAANDAAHDSAQDSAQDSAHEAAHDPARDVAHDTTHDTAHDTAHDATNEVKNDAPRTRVVLLGASNLARSFRIAIARLSASIDGPLDVLATPWPGRSYGLGTRVLFRELPSIRDCGLWKALDARPPLPLVAVVLDAGNDLAYGVPAREAARWIEECIARLAHRGALGACMTLPLSSLDALGELRFRAARMLLFPTRRVVRAHVIAEARVLDARVREAASAHGFALVEPERAWFGLDPIHWKLARRREAWDAVVAALELGPASSLAPLRLHGARFEAETLFGRARSVTQPSGSGGEGTRISWF